jgi:23S rRNA pseudouridine1911/1915/1917 synthase
MKNQTIKLLHAPDEKDPFIVIDKPAGLPSAPLKETDRENALYQTAQLFPQILLIKGLKPIEYGLIHRIDTVTRGLLIIAADQHCFNTLIAAQKNGFFIKTYKAVCSIENNYFIKLPGWPAPEQDYLPDILSGKNVLIKSYFRPYGIRSSEVRPVNKNSSISAIQKAGSRLYCTKVQLNTDGKSYDEKKISVICSITAGYRHQVRCHLAWIGLPVCGDTLYNPEDTESRIFCFEATGIEFPHPITGVKTAFQL